MAVSLKLGVARELLDGAATTAPSLPKVYETSERHQSYEIKQTHLKVRLRMECLNLQTPTDMSNTMRGVLDVLGPWCSLDNGDHSREEEGGKEGGEDFAEGD
jgi:hypothetical protein